MSCPSNLIRNIRPTENIGGSLITLNNNFWSLGTTLCNLKDRLESLVEVRTFFYYGPNAGTNPASQFNDQTNRPSNRTIENFVNSNNNLNLAEFSRPGDQVYVVYQKTGYQRSTANQIITGTQQIKVIGIGFKTASYTIRIPNDYNTFSPVFIIWKLTARPVTTTGNTVPASSFSKTKYQGPLQYRVDDGFPKFTQAETFSTDLWKTPNAWTDTF
jgi:hypothetical protein